MKCYPVVGRRRLALGFAAALLLVAPKAGAYVTEGVQWANATTTIYYTLTGGTAAETAAMKAAMLEWNAVTAFKFVPVASSADPCNSRLANGVAFGTDECGSAFGSSTLAVTFYQTRGGISLTHAGVVFNSAKTFNVYDGRLQSFAVDIQRVATHEFGHVLGLDHEQDLGIPAIMQPNVSDTDRPTDDDIAGVAAIYGPATPIQTSIVSAVLPASRSVQIGSTATAFATIANAGATAAANCQIALASPISANFSFQTTSAATNRATGSPNTPVTIAGNGSQSFLISVTPAAQLNPTDVAFAMQCDNTQAAPSTVGLNTLLLSASNVPTPDIVALAATARSDGYVHLTPSSGAFALATVNVGASGQLTVSADTGSANLPVSITLCQTNPSTGQCTSPIGTTVPSTTINANATPTFSVFVSSTGSVTADPANNRIFVRFRDSNGATRGSTSVAVTSQ